jgi:hypothetical protein
VTDVTDGFIFEPLAVSFIQFQNQAVLKSPDFETRAAKWALMVYHLTAGIILYRDYLYGNLYQMPILYVEIDI